MDLKKSFQQIDCNLNVQIPEIPQQSQDDIILPSICKQIEFYLGDANLSHDQFFNKHITENGYVPLDVFLKCNKIKKLMENYPKFQKGQLKILALALKRSKILKVDKLQTYVKRRKSFEQNDDYLDKRTIFIDNLPKDLSPQVLHEIFANVDAHILNAQVKKGYGFITFLNQESVQQAIKRYNNVCPKEILSRGIMMNDGLRVLTKEEWTQFKTEAKEIIQVLKPQGEQQQIENEVSVKLINIATTDLTPHEVRIAVSHCIQRQDIINVHLDKDLFCCTLKLANEENAAMLKYRIDRLRQYDIRFKDCRVL
ncbi:hypothetical protein pb186bvf_017637 [Paramecium bursaria]